MEFKIFKTKIQKNFEEMVKGDNDLFVVDLDKDELWDLYLNSFKPEDNKMFRKRREYDCSCCRSFIKNIGNVVSIKNGKLITIWDFEIEGKFKPVAKALRDFVASKKINNFYISKVNDIGTDKNLERLENGNIITWEHFYLRLPNKFVNKSCDSNEMILGNHRDTRNVFKRSLDEISSDSISTILELISSKNLYKGEEWQDVLIKFLEYKKEYDKLKNNEEKELFAWKNSKNAGIPIGRIKNNSIGTLLINISEGMDLETAIKKYEVIVAPSNYKRPKPIFTKKMLEDAKKTIMDLGYMDSLERRYATLNDININNILFANKNIATKINEGDIFSKMLDDVQVSPKKFSKVKEITIEDFLKNVLPTSKEIYAYLDNKHSKNLVSLIAPKKESKTMFKWNNNFGWAYKGNVTDSIVKNNVKNAGGKVDGVLRFSIQWNDLDDYNKDDLDAHCIEPHGYEIYFGNKREMSLNGGILDVDIQNPIKGVPAVENITWEDIKKMGEGEYKFFVHNYSYRGGRNGFRAEIEFDGNIYSYNYNLDIRDRQKVEVATVIYSKKDGFSIKENLSSNISSNKVWNLSTNTFIPVQVVMYSPNYWDEQNGNGNKHYMFMLKDCINNENPSGFYNEFLNSSLIQHKKVFEALGGNMKVEDSENQLSGLGFSSTQRNELIVKVDGKILKIKF